MKEKIELLKARKLTDRVTRIEGIATELMYLVEGDEKAAVIDGGFGSGNLKEFVEALTDKPVFLILTHGHVDHVLAAPLFDEVYLNPADEQVYSENWNNISKRDGYVRFKIREKADMLTAEDFVTPRKVKYKTMKPGDIFNLGGIHLDICPGAGHTPGMVTILIREERSLVTGDACNPTTLLALSCSLPVSEYKKSMESLYNTVKGKYDRVYLSHGHVACPDGDAPKEILPSVIDICKDIVNGRADDMKGSHLGMDIIIAKKINPDGTRVDGGIGNVYYFGNR